MQLRRRIVIGAILQTVWISVLGTQPLVAQAGSPQTSRPLTVDRDPSPSIDPDEPTPASPSSAAQRPGQVGKDASGRYTLRADAYEVLLNASAFDATGRRATNLSPSSFHIFEDGVPQKISSFRHQDVTVSIGLLIDNSASMYDKHAAVAEAAADLLRLSSPKDEAFVVNFSSKPYLDQDLTSSVDQLRRSLRNVSADGGTAAYDAVVASAQYLMGRANNTKKVIVLITDGADNSSKTTLAETIRRVQNLDSPAIYCVGLLFGNDIDKVEAKKARTVLQEIADQTGGVAFFPEDLRKVAGTAAIIADDIRFQYTIGYRSTNAPSNGGYRAVHVDAFGSKHQQLVVRTRSGYVPNSSPAITESAISK